VRIALGLQDRLELGNMGAKRDWGHSKDYVRAMWLMLQQGVPADYVIASGETRTVREFVDAAFRVAGLTLEWKGQGIDETAVDMKTGRTVVSVSPRFFRPAEVELLLGTPKKAETQLGWRREIGFEELVSRMVQNDMALVKRES
jgi:GDPmannose 4,6-dehydratase